MHTLLLLVVFYFRISQLYVSTSDITAQCGEWQVFKEKKCIKVFDSNGVESYNGAQTKCSHNENSKLLTIDSREEQAFVISLLYHNYNIRHNVWLGAQYNNQVLDWVDNTEVNYTNLDQTAVNDTGCVLMSLQFKSFGKWFVENCDNKNVVVCQKNQSALYVYFRNQIIDLKIILENNQKELKDTKINLENLQFREDLSNQMLESIKYNLYSKLEDFNDAMIEMKISLNSTQNESAIVITKLQEMVSNLKQNQLILQETVAKLNYCESKLQETVFELKQSKDGLQTTVNNLKQSVIPVGFIYAQFPGQNTPQEIWSWMTWKDITPSFAGLFFRAFGGNSSSFGSTQEENAPQITKVQSDKYTEHEDSVNGENRQLTHITNGEWSKWLFTGKWEALATDIRFFSSSGEVRPRNTAIRIWKRIA